MATYTWEELKDLSSVSAVEQWSEDKCLLYQTTAETILSNLNMDMTMSGYSTAYNSAVIHLFDWIASNPTGLRSTRKGKVSNVFTVDDLPPVVAQIVKPFIESDSGTLTPAVLSRRDIGLR